MDTRELAAVLVTQAVVVFGLVINARRGRKTHAAVEEVEKHVNSVEIEVAADDGNVTLGQRQKRMEDTLRGFVEENRDAHDRIVVDNRATTDEIQATIGQILNSEPRDALTAFRLAFQDRRDVGAYQLVPNPDTPWGYSLEWINNRCKELWGLSLHEAETQHPSTVDARDRDRVEDAVRLAATNGTNVVVRYLNRNVRTDEATDVTAIFEPYYTQRGDAIGWIGTICPVETT